MYLQISPVSGRWCVRLGLVGAIVGSAIAFGSPALAQVVADPTVGSTVNGVSGGEQTITGGTRQGGNLFHSFERFSVPTNGTAFFNNAPDIQNILSRVTGGSISDIDGLIQANGAANLFLLNPNGIIFGQNARLDVGGSFVATTASSINFADGTQFSATPGTGAPLLTVSVPLGLQFGTGAGEIVNRASGVGLQVDAGKTLGLVGGNVNLEGGRLTASGGRIELGAVAAPGVVGISPDNSGFRFGFPTDLTLADISLTNNSRVNVIAGDGGNIVGNARNFSILGGSVLIAGIGTSLGSVGAVAGDIEINAQDAVTIDGTATPDNLNGIVNVVFGIGDSGNIFINADSVILNGDSQISSASFGQGNAGSVNITARDRVSLASSSAFLSAVDSSGKGNGADINIQTSSLSLSDGALLSTSSFGQGSAGNIQITATEPNNSVSVSGGSSITTDSSGIGNAGNVIITANGNVSVDTNSFIDSSLNEIPADSTRQLPPVPSDRKGGDITIQARSLDLTNGSFLNATTFSQGNAGNIDIDVSDTVTLDRADSSRTGIFNNTQNPQGGTSSEGGDINIKAGSLLLKNGAVISASTLGQGDAGSVILLLGDRLSLNNNSTIYSSVEQNARGNGGDISIKARSLDLSNGAELNASTSGQGNAGNVLVQVNESINLANSSYIFSTVEPGAIGNGGTVDVEANSLSLTSGAQIQALVRGTSDTLPGGRGNAGSIDIDVSNTFTATGRDRDGFRSGVFNDLGSGAVGKGGDINIKVGSLYLDNAELSASTFGQGNAGNMFLQANESINLVNSSDIFSNVERGGTGNGGNITLKARSLSLSDGAQIAAATFSEGNAGNIDIDVSDTISFIGADNIDGFLSGVFSNVESGGRGNGGNITLKARSLSLTDGAQIGAATFSQGNAGNIDIDVSDSVSFAGADNSNNFLSGVFSNVEPGGRGNGGNITLKARSLSLTDGGQITAATFSEGNAGNIDIDVSDTISFAGADGSNCFCSGVFSTVEAEGIGNGGNITLKGRSLSLNNGGRLNASSFRQGNAGNIIVDIHTLDLDNGSILAQSASGNGGNIQLQIDKRLTLRNSSRISTTAGTEQQPGDGGDITINSPLIIAALVNEFNQDSDITANAFTGTGGNIKITSQGIFGIQPRREATPDTNDITASSDLGVSGTIQINSPEVDPSRDIVELPTGLVDASALVAAGCPSGAENRFTVAGRGGLPPAPGDNLSSDALLTDWATLQTPETQNRAAVETTTSAVTSTTPTPPVETITEATSWQYDRNGAIILTSGDTTSPNHLKATPTSCSSS